MKVLIFSDSHGKAENMLRAVSLHPDAEYIVHLGDGSGDSSFFDSCAVYMP